MTSGANGRKTFRLILIKPSHYDDDGYVIQWLRSPIPANSLACLYGLARRLRRAAGARRRRRRSTSSPSTRPTRASARTRIARAIREAGARHGHAGRRAVEPVPARARPRAAAPRGAASRSASAASTSPARSPCCRASSRTCRRRSTSAPSSSPARRRRAGSSRCCATRSPARLKPIYNFMDDLPGIERVPIAASAGRGRAAHLRREHQLRRRPRLPVPVLVLHHHQRAGPQVAPPLAPTTSSGSCATNAAQGICRFFITDDNFARNKDWEPIFDRLIELREGERHRHPPHHPGRHALPPDAELHREGGARRRAARLHRAREHQPRQPRRRRRRGRTRSPNTARCCSPGRRPSVITYCGYILGFPNDTPERIERDIEVIQRELPVDLLEFFFLTPLPGSEDHKKLLREGRLRWTRTSTNTTSTTPSPAIR